MEQRIVIKKRNSSDIVCWKEDASKLTPNTVIELESGLVAVIKVDGKRKVQTQSSTTVFGLFNLGKDKKFFGGKKTYKGENEICVIDRASEFEAEWGFGKFNPIPCHSFEFDVDCEAVATGLYTYQISNYADFVSSIPMKGNVITRGDVREFLRSLTSGVISAYLAEVLVKEGLSKCRANMASMSDELIKRINAKLNGKGLEVANVMVQSLDYTDKWKKAYEMLNEAKVAGTLGDQEIEHIVKILALGEAQNKYLLPRLRALADMNSPKEHHEKGRIIYCHECGEQNVDSDFCKKCGAKLHKGKGE